MAIMTLRDLRRQFGPARNQGSRPTCIAFAFSDGHAAARGEPEPLSAEHLYYHAVQRTAGRDPHDGVAMPTCIAALGADGQSAEAGWPYIDPLTDLSSWTPPASATPVFPPQYRDRGGVAGEPHRRARRGAADGDRAPAR